MKSFCLVDSTSTVVVGIHDLKNTPYTRHGVSTNAGVYQKLEKENQCYSMRFWKPL